MKVNSICDQVLLVLVTVGLLNLINIRNFGHPHSFQLIIRSMWLLNIKNDKITVIDCDKSWGYSIRCIKN